VGSCCVNNKELLEAYRCATTNQERVDAATADVILRVAKKYLLDRRAKGPTD